MPRTQIRCKDRKKIPFLQRFGGIIIVNKTKSQGASRLRRLEQLPRGVDQGLLLGVAIGNKSAADMMSENLKINYPAKIMSGVFGTSTENIPPLTTGETGGGWIWIPNALQGGNSFGLLIAWSMTNQYVYRYHLCVKWYINWGTWKTIG